MNRGFPAKYWCRPALLGFGVGVLAGIVFGSRPETVEPALKTEPLHESTRTMETVNNGGTAAMPSSKPESKSVPQSADCLARLRALTSLNANLKWKIGIEMLIGEDLNEDFVRVFGLSPAEAQRLREELKATRRKLSELEARVAKIAGEGNGEFVISIPEAPAESGIIHDDLMRTIRETLGPQRLDYAQSLSSFTFERLERFGMRRVEIHLKPMHEHGQPAQKWVTSLDESTGTMIQTITMDPTLLKDRFPLIRQKMVDAGFLAPEL